MTDKPPTVLERLWDDVPVRPVPIEGLMVTAQVARRRRLIAGAAALGILAAGVVGLNSVMGKDARDHIAEGSPSATPPRLGGDFQPIEVRPTAARAGQAVELSFPESGSRGVAFSLDVWVGGEWQPRYYLTSNGGVLGWEPSWWSVEDDEEHFVPDIGVGGSGPDVVVVPSTATQAHYRICTANAADRACGLLEVVE